MSMISLFIGQGTVFQDTSKPLIIKNFKEKGALPLLCKKSQPLLKIIKFLN